MLLVTIRKDCMDLEAMEDAGCPGGRVPQQALALVAPSACFLVCGKEAVASSPLLAQGLVCGTALSFPGENLFALKDNVFM